VKFYLTTDLPKSEEQQSQSPHHRTLHGIFKRFFQSDEEKKLERERNNSEFAVI
jgi:hypothetical protein